MDKLIATDGSQPPAFADRLRAARQAAGLTQGEAASRAGISRPAWNRYERGHRSPSIEQAARLAAAVGATLDELVRPARLPEVGRQVDRKVG